MSRFAILVRSALLIAIGLAAATARADDARSGIDAGNAALRAAVLAGDAQKVADLYASNAEIIPAGAPIASSPAAILDFWKGFIAAAPRDLVLETRSVETAGGIAVEDGTLKITAKDGAVSTSRYVVVWKKEAGGWKLFRDIWNEAK